MSVLPSRSILVVHSGADHPESVTRMLAGTLLERLAGPDVSVVHRTALEGLPVVTGAWVAASFADGDRAALALSDVLVDELLAADELVLVAPVYNFGIPAALKAWIDQVVRADRTFRFTQTGVEGLTGIRRAWIVTASGSTAVGSDTDFNTTYLRTILGFIGIVDVEVVAADQLRVDPQAAIARAMAAIDRAQPVLSA
jgi:FMN-dependent NADH-azoreductase